MEAMSCGTPVVVSNNSVMKELVENGKTGLKFETFNFEEYVDRLEYLLTNDHEARRMEVSARKYVLDNFSFPVIEKKLYGICREVLE
jgi:glycosyltransferase involved in cell wall biosynthesis